MRNGWGILIVLFWACWLLPGTAVARPLSKQDCKELSRERADLAKSGIEKAIVKGPGWTNSNMPAGTLEQVRHYLSVEEKLRFRCKGIKLPDLAPEQTAAAEIKDAEKIKPRKETDKKPKKDVTGAIVTPKSPEKKKPAKSKAAQSKPEKAKPEKASEKKTVSLQAALISPASQPNASAPAASPLSSVPLPDRKPKRANVMIRARKKVKVKKPEPAQQSISSQFNADGG